ncbi:MAG: PorV/PorQ family protein [bacterium]
MRAVGKMILAVLMLAVAGEGVHAQNVNYAGTSAANFLKISPITRNSAMGDAPLSSGSGAGGVMFNPASIAGMSEGSITISSMKWLVDTRVSYLAASYPLSPVSTVAVDIDYFGTGDIDETTIAEQDGTGRVFNASDLMIGATFAAKLTDRFSAGGKVKVINENLSQAQATAFAVDIGSTFRTNFLNNLEMNFVLSNFGSKLQFNGRDLEVLYTVPDSPTGKEVPARMKTESWELPLLFRLGVETNVFQTNQMRLHLVYQLLDSRDYEARHLIGAEYVYDDFVYLRAGYKANWDEASWTAGFGFNIHMPNMGQVIFDYAAADWGVFGVLQQFGVGFRF